MKSLKSLLLVAALPLLVSGAALAGPINDANVNLDPTGVGAPNTGDNGQQICPDILQCPGNLFVNPLANTFTITMLTDGLWSGSIAQAKRLALAGCSISRRPSRSRVSAAARRAVRLKTSS